MNKKLKPHQLFLYLSIVFGFSLIVFTPPFQVPDEINHFYRAWQVSEGTFSSVKENQRLGGYIPKSLEKLSSQFSPFTLNPYNKISPKLIWETRLIPLNANDTIFKDFTNTALYSAFLYLPQALGIFIGKHFGLNPLWLVYLGRLFNLLASIIIVYYAITIMPFKKWLLVLLAFLPMSLSINSSMSADVLLNALSFLLIALALNLCFNENIQQISNKNILVIFILSILIGLAKLVYVPILFLLVLIPARKFSSNKARILILVTIIFAGIGTALMQKSVIDSKYIPYSKYNASYRDKTILKKGVDIQEQIEFIKSHPKHTLIVFAKSFFSEFKDMSIGYIGILGWCDINLPIWFVYLAYILIFFLVMINFENSNISDFTFIKRSVLGLIVLCLIVLIMLSQYLSWDLVGEENVYPLQGRYFIPVFPLFFLLFFNVLKINGNYFLENNIDKMIVGFCLFSGLLSIYLIIEKIYTLYDYSNIKWKVNYSFKENTQDSSKTNNNIEYILVANDTLALFNKPKSKFITDEKVYTGSHSLKLSKNNKYGCSLEILKGMANDKIIISCRTYGYDVSIVFQEFPKGLYYKSEKIIVQKDSLGWNYREAQFILPHNIPNHAELRTYLYCSNQDSIYVDDFKVTYLKKE